MSALEELGGETWFRLGDKDLAMNVERSRRLKRGDSLGQVTAALAKLLGVRHTVLPMSNDPVRTLVHTEHGEMEFQDYFVRERCGPVVNGFDYRGAPSARINPDIQEWLGSERLAGIILCPSSPFISIDPILSLPGLREALRVSTAPVIAISPVVGGRALKGPLTKMMREMSIPSSASWIAEHYHDFLDGFILDSADESLASGVEATGVTTTVTPIVMNTLGDRVRLAETAIGFIASLNERNWAKAVRRGV